jgi:hypothetical protein
MIGRVIPETMDLTDPSMNPGGETATVHQFQCWMSIASGKSGAGGRRIRAWFRVEPVGMA